MSNADIVRRIYQAFAEGDLDAALELIHPDVEWIESEGIPYGGTFRGREAVVEGVFVKIGEEWEGFRADLHEVLEAGDVVITLGVDHGTYKATGQFMSAPTASVWRLWDGRVVSFRQYIDTLAVARACERRGGV